MGEKERFEILEKEKIDKKVYFYLKHLFDELKIEILSYYQGNLFDLMKRGKLEGWCWQTTETAALFMPDDIIVYRGNLYFNEYKTYYHGFIEFNYENKKYIFDPCFCMINTSELYFNTFNIDIKGYTTAKKIKEYFFNYIQNPLKEENKYNLDIISSTDKFMKKFFGDDYLEKREKEIIIYGVDNPSSPMYRNNSGYKNIIIENKKIKSLTAHYYIGG